MFYRSWLSLSLLFFLAHATPHSATAQHPGSGIGGGAHAGSMGGIGGGWNNFGGQTTRQNYGNQLMRGNHYVSPSANHTFPQLQRLSISPQTNVTPLQTILPRAIYIPPRTNVVPAKQPPSLLLPKPLLTTVAPKANMLILGTPQKPTAKPVTIAPNPIDPQRMPVPIKGAVHAAEAAAPFSEGQIMLSNPLPDAVNYSLNQQPFSMASNFEQTLPPGTTWVVEFDRGGDFGVARYTLSEGFYVFASTDRGWDLYKRKFQATLDNSHSTFEFNYVVDGQAQTLKPGESQELSSNFPPVLRFDNGNGSELSRRLETDSYRVAIADDMKIDLYRAEDVVAPLATAPR